MNRHYIYIQITLSMLILVAMGNASAGTPKGRYGPTALELAGLPVYCQAKIGKDPVKKGIWRKKMGRKNFVHLHHYCYALNFLNRAAKVVSDRNLKHHYYKNAVSNFNYVLQRWKPTFSLYSQAQSYRNRAIAMMKLQ